MREIKFRAWKYPKEFANNIKSEGEMLYAEMESEKNYMVSSHTGWIFYECKENMSDVMQFTGLKDKYGEEVYEKDIIQVGDTNEIILIEDIRFMHNLLYEHLEKHVWIKILGNVWQNPELLIKKGRS